MKTVNYFEVLYANCFGEKRVAIVATPHDTPAEPTSSFNFNWNGNELIEFCKTDFESYRTNAIRFLNNPA